MKHFLLLLPLLLIAPTAFAGYVKGKITDDKGEPLPFASIYVKNTTYGVSSNLKGDYFLELDKGEYTVTYSFVGYETVEKQVTIGSSPTILDVILKESSNALKQVEIVANTKDRAKEIMKLVRDNRRDYLTAIENYTCTTYLKTSLEKESINPTSDSTSSKSKNDDLKNHLKKEKLNLIESVSEVYFERPGKLKEIILGHHDYAEVHGESRGASITIDVGTDDIAPVQYQSENPYLMYNGARSTHLNFYKNLINFPALSQTPLLSPIAANSALSYTYNYEGAFYEGDQKIYKLAVKPIYKSEALFSGIIFIEDSTWALRSVDLTVNKAALLFCKEFQIIQNYKKVSDEAYLPYRREFNYVIKDGGNHVIGNTRVDHSNYKVNIEIPAKTFGNEVIRYVDDAFDKDTSYWSNQRPITLKTEELDFIHETDSLREYYTSEEYYREIDSSFNVINIWTPLNGLGHRNRFKGTEWYISGLFEQVNPFGIGGYRHKLPGYFNKEFKNSMLLETKGFVDYGFKNKDVKGKFGVGLTYIPKKFVRTFIEVGDFYDYINDYASLEQTFSRSNYIREKSFSIAQRMEIVNGLYGELKFEFSDQQPINNLELSNWSNQLFGGLNTPTDFERYIKSEMRLELKYRIRQKYMIKGGKKIVIGADYPELSLIYRKGLPGVLNSEVDFSYIEIGARDEMQLARFGSSRWEVTAGTFLSKSNLRILEYKFFRGSDRWFFSDPVRSFQLLGPTMSTPNEFLKANYIHHFEGTILNKVPLINRLGLGLAGGAGTLVIPDNDFHHFEMFAGLEKVVRIKKQLFRFGAYAVTADNSLSSPEVTFKFGINFYNTFTKKWDY